MDLLATFYVVIWSMNSRLNNGSPQKKNIYITMAIPLVIKLEIT